MLRNLLINQIIYHCLTFQIAALERSRKIEDLQKRLVESEMLRTKYNRKLTMLKDQMRSMNEAAEQERSINDHSMQLLRDELAQVKQNLLEVRQNLTETTRRESQVNPFSGIKIYCLCFHNIYKKIFNTPLPNINVFGSKSYTRCVPK